MRLLRRKRRAYYYDKLHVVSMISLTIGGLFLSLFLIKTSFLHKCCMLTT